MKIRTAALQDASSINQLVSQLGYEPNLEKIITRLKTIFASNEDNVVYVATINHTVIGWIHGFYTLRVESDPFVEIGGLVVDQKSRVKGVGKKLVEQVCEWAKAKQCASIRVRCNSKRIESHLFYEKIDFKLNKEQKIFNRQLI